MRRDAQVSLQGAEVLARKGERKKERALGVGIMPRLRVRLLLLLSLPLSLLSLSLSHWADSNSGDALSAPQSGLAGAPQELAHCPLGVALHASSTTCGKTSAARRRTVVVLVVRNSVRRERPLADSVRHSVVLSAST